MVTCKRVVGYSLLSSQSSLPEVMAAVMRSDAVVSALASEEVKLNTTDALTVLQSVSAELQLEQIKSEMVVRL